MKKDAEKQTKKKNASFLVLLIGLFLLVAASVALVLSLTLGQKDNEVEEIIEIEEVAEIEEPILPEAVDFQPVVDEWIKTVKSGNKSVLIYDLNLDKIVGEYNATEKYSTASLYKLFVVYEGYKRVYTGAWDGDAKAGRTGLTISKCLDLAIRQSDSDCAEALWSLIGHDTLDTIIEQEWGIVDSDISKLISNPTDIMKIMKRFYEHPDFDNPELLAAMQDSFLNQPTTEYNWRQGLPSGFKTAEVYNKVGWDYNPDGKYWNIYHDVAIVKFPLDDGTTRDFIVIVMTNKVDFKNIKKFGEMLENAF